MGKPSSRAVGFTFVVMAPILLPWLRFAGATMRRPGTPGTYLGLPASPDVVDEEIGSPWP
jgi:hypothetical protein